MFKLSIFYYWFLIIIRFIIRWLFFWGIFFVSSEELVICFYRYGDREEVMIRCWNIIIVDYVFFKWLF